MDTLINLILAAALQFTGAHIMQQDLKISHQETTSTEKKCVEYQAYFNTKNEQFCKETITQ